MPPAPRIEAPPALPVVDLHDLRFSWHLGAPPVLAVDAFRIGPGEHLFLHGASGSGKSTLLSLLAGVSIPQAGQLTVLGIDLPDLAPDARDRFRADHIGLVFQMFNLVPYLTALENVLLPCGFSKRREARARARSGTPRDEALRLLTGLGLDTPDLQKRLPARLSVGQQQRVAAARALIGDPELVIADEPTSALDADRRDAFLDLLFLECGRSGAALLFVSHDSGIAARFDRRIDLADINAATPLECAA
jgi:putative ABC transport system ATP-binding protein